MSSRKSKSPVEIASDFVTDSIESVKTNFTDAAAPAKEGFEAVNKAASAVQARFAEFQMKGVEMAEDNAKATFAFWRDALTVKSPDALFSLQQNFVKTQAETTMRRMQDMNTLAVALLRDAATPVQESFGKAFAALQPKQAA